MSRSALTLYKLVASLIRSYANIANEMAEAGYHAAEIETVKKEVDHYEKVRDEVKLQVAITLTSRCTSLPCGT